jgi:hypothetical protein
MVFVDFDGVICDSINECYVSSWLAVRDIVRRSPATDRATDQEWNAIDLAVYRRFREYRPFIRRGADYVLLQQCIRTGRRLRSQSDFDHAEKAAGADTMKRYHNAFYAVRERMLSEHRSFWLGLNALYPGARSALLGATVPSYIISTKKAEFVAQIFTHHGVPWPTERIIYSGSTPKVEIVGRMLDESSAARAFLVEDQIDHLVETGDVRIQGRLAGWGYVKPEWLEQSLVPVINMPDLANLLLGIC